jgi:hypothetical protein
MAELRDRAGIFTGETAEAWSDLQFAVRRDPGRLALAQHVLSEAMRRVIASRPAPSNPTAPAVTTALRRRRT